MCLCMYVNVSKRVYPPKSAVYGSLDKIKKKIGSAIAKC